jgi:hypothetical protein
MDSGLAIRRTGCADNEQAIVTMLGTLLWELLALEFAKMRSFFFRI